MKNKFLLLVLIVGFSFAYSQVTDVMTNLSSAGIANLTYKDNYIYFTSYTQKKVYKFDYTSTSPTAELVYQFNENPNYLFINDNILYVGVESPFKTYTIDLNCQNVQPVLFANICGPMVQMDNDLYIGQYVAEKIVKIDLSTNTQTDVLIGYKPNFFTLHDDELYFTSNTTNTIYKYNAQDNTTTNIMNNLNYASGIAMNDDFLLICESSGNSISYYSLPNYQYTNIIQLSPSSWPNGSVIIDDELYFTQTVAGKISKLQLDSLNTPLSNNTPSKQSNSISIYPNPTNGLFTIKSDIQIEKYEIYNVEGKLVQNSNVQNNKVDVSMLSNGTYMLLLDSKPITLVKK